MIAFLFFYLLPTFKALAEGFDESFDLHKEVIERDLDEWKRLMLEQMTLADGKMFRLSAIEIESFKTLSSSEV